MSLRIVIVEDEANARKILISLLKELDPDCHILAELTSVKEAKSAIPELEFDLLLLDVQLRDGNGFDLLRELNDIHFQIIFTTAYSEYAIEAFKVNALDYLLKPLDVDELSSSLSKIRKMVAEGEKKNKQLIDFLNNNASIKRLALNERNRIVFVQPKHIIYFKADGAYTKVICEDNLEYLSSHNLGYFEKKMDKALFMRTHRSYLINIQKVLNIRTDEHQLEMTNGDLASLSGKLKQTLIDRLA